MNTFLFGLYLLAIGIVFFIGVMVVISKKKVDSLDKIAQLQHWEYLRSLKKDGYK